MKILNLFLIFIQFTLCFGVDDLLPHPGELTDYTNDNQIASGYILKTNNIVKGLNNSLIEKMQLLQTNLDRLNAKYLVIQQDLAPFEEGNILNQYDQLSDALKQLNIAKKMIHNGLYPDKELRLGSNRDYLETLKNKNIQMQNEIIKAMKIIIDNVNAYVRSKSFGEGGHHLSGGNGYGRGFEQ